jgi:hypothetical protein
MQMTPRQYYAALDAAVNKCGFTKNQLKAAVLIRSTNGRQDRSWIETLAPIYIYLRNQGFNHVDLTR